jgi:hypothetical protein
MKPEMLAQWDDHGFLATHVHGGFVSLRIEDALFESMDLEKVRSEAQINRCGSYLTLVKERRHNEPVLYGLSAQCSHQFLMRQNHHGAFQSCRIRDISIAFNIERLNSRSDVAAARLHGSSPRSRI